LPSLQEQLLELKARVSQKVPEEFMKITTEEVQKLIESKTIDGLSVGSKAPEFSLPDSQGNLVTLSETLQKGPVVLSFYRGSWWPYCVVELRELHGAVSNQTEIQTSILAISPERTENSAALAKQLQVSFPLLSDVKGQVMHDYRVAWVIPQSIRDLYLKLFKRDLNVINTGAGWILPVPATYIINQDGVIVHRYVNEDYTTRMEPADIVDILRSL
jgi:peroxiredoxin